jgi:hypothetical protein
MKFILLIELPSRVTLSQRNSIKKKLEKIAYENPKRNVYLMEIEKESQIEAIKIFIIRDGDPKSKVSYYQLAEY